MKNLWKKIVEKIIWNLRLFLLIPIFSFLIISIFLLVISVKKSYYIIISWLNWYSLDLLWNIVSLIDLILLSIILIIFAWWIYELFIDEIKLKEKTSSKAKHLIIENIDELKESLWKVIIIMLIVNLFKILISFKIETWQDIIAISISILFLALSIKFLPKNKQD